MIQFILFIVYLALCYWVASQARNTRAGLIGTFLLCMLATPLLTFIFFYVFQSTADIALIETADQPQTVTITPVK